MCRRAMSAEKVLVHELLDNYDDVGVIGRPVVNLSTPVHVQFGLGLIQMEVEEKENMLRLSAWTRYVSKMSSHNYNYWQITSYR